MVVREKSSQLGIFKYMVNIYLASKFIPSVHQALFKESIESRWEGATYKIQRILFWVKWTSFAGTELRTMDCEVSEWFSQRNASDSQLGYMNIKIVAQNDITNFYFWWTGHHLLDRMELRTTDCEVYAWFCEKHLRAQTEGNLQWSQKEKVVPHVQTVSTELSLDLVAFAAVSTMTESFLPAKQHSPSGWVKPILFFWVRNTYIVYH